MTITPPIPPSGTLWPPIAPASRPQASTSDPMDFQAVLSALQASQPTFGTDTSLTGLDGFGLDQSSVSIEPLLTLTLMRLLERLLDQSGAAATSDSTQPQGQPVEGPISQEYHEGHRALDIAVPVGTPVRATLAGHVVYSGWNDEGYGNLVIVENGPYRTYYAHLSQLQLAVGDSVSAGMVVGLSGNTGHSTGPHLHYEVRLNGQPIPPDQLPTGRA